MVPDGPLTSQPAYAAQPEYDQFPPMERDADAPIGIAWALEDALMQAEKLAQLVNELFIKAAPLMREQAETAAKMDTSVLSKTMQAPRYASPTAEKAHNVGGQLRFIQTRVARLINELDA